jgi:SPP1 family predicted phage head-tail adaptor
MIFSNMLDRQIELQQYSFSKSAFGEKEQSWNTLATVPASIKPVTGKEVLRSGQITSEFDVIVRIRHIQGVAPKDRFVYDGEIYDIQGVSEIGRREGLEITAKKAVK